MAIGPKASPVSFLPRFNTAARALHLAEISQTGAP